jgi:hypothetical protein
MTDLAPVVLLLATLVAVVTSVQQPAASTTRFSCLATAEDPVLDGTTVSCTAENVDDKVAWLRIDRAERSGGNSADNRNFPLWVKRSWGWSDIDVHFQGEVGANHTVSTLDVGSVALVASGWDARWNRTQVSPNSPEVVIHYNWTGFRAQTFRVDVEILPNNPNALTLRGVGVSSSLPTATHWTFWNFFPAAVSGGLAAEGSSGAPPTFSAGRNFALQAYGANGSVTVAFPAPGIYYWGVTTASRGIGGASSAGGKDSLFTQAGATTPVAILALGSDGRTGNDTLPAGFAGQTFHLPAPVVGEYQFCFTTTNVTIFAGAKFYLPLCPNPGAATFTQIHYASVRAPRWLTVVLQGMHSNSSTAAELRGATSGDGGDDDMITTTAPLSMSIAQHAQGGSVPLDVAFESETWAGHSLSLQLAMHRTAAPPATDSAQWQTLTATAVPTPHVPLPKSMVTSITWSSPNQLLFTGTGSGDGGGDTVPRNYSMLENYRQLGFNTVPFKSSQRFVETSGDQQAPALLFPGNRTDGPWADGALKFGPEHSGHFSSHLWKGPLNESLLRDQYHVKPADMATEMLKWERALNYSAKCARPDVGYDGAIFQAYVQDTCKAAQFMQSEYIFADDEFWGDGWHNFFVSKDLEFSSNSQARRLAGESDENLAFRMMYEMFVMINECMGDTQLMDYGTHKAPAEVSIGAVSNLFSE